MKIFDILFDIMLTTYFVVVMLLGTVGAFLDAIGITTVNDGKLLLSIVLFSLLIVILLYPIKEGIDKLNKNIETLNKENKKIKE